MRGTLRQEREGRFLVLHNKTVGRLGRFPLPIRAAASYLGIGCANNNKAGRWRSTRLNNGSSRMPRGSSVVHGGGGGGFAVP